MQKGGKLSSFVHRCLNLGTVIWKFRNLFIALLRDAWPEIPDFESLHFEQNGEIHWYPRMPPARPFPQTFYPTFSWDLRSPCVQFLELQTQTAIRKNMQYTHHLLDVPQFNALFPERADTFLRSDFISPLWVGRCRRKTTLLAWEKFAFQVIPSRTVPSVTAKTIEFWQAPEAPEIKNMISPSKSAKRHSYVIINIPFL